MLHTPQPNATLSPDQHNTATPPASDACTLRVLKLDDRARLPQYHSEHAAGMDLAACLPRGDITTAEVVIAPGAIVKIPLGFAVAIPFGHEGQVRPRSGLSTRHGVTVPNAPGTVDADYRGEMFVALINLGPEPYTVHDGDRIAQLIIAPVSRVSISVCDSLDRTDRGDGGFGSTGRGS